MAQIPPPIPVYTVFDGMVEYGVDNTVNFNTQTPAKRIAEELVDNDFTSCMDKTLEELRSDFKNNSYLTVAQGQIRLTPGVKRNIQAYIQIVMDEIHMGRDPKSEQFDIGETGTLLRRFNTHNKYIHKIKDITRSCKTSSIQEHNKMDRLGSSNSELLKYHPRKRWGTVSIRVQNKPNSRSYTTSSLSGNVHQDGLATR